MKMKHLSKFWPIFFGALLSITSCGGDKKDDSSNKSEESLPESSLSESINSEESLPVEESSIEESVPTEESLPVESEESTPSEDVPGEHYNEENFIDGDRNVIETKVVTYEAPSLLTSSSLAKVKVNDHDLFVYETRVNDRRKFSWDLPTRKVPVVTFDFEGKVHLEIEVPENVTSATVSPLVYGITPKINGKKISFDLSYTGNYVVEYNGNSDTSIMIFANPLETEKMTEAEAASDPNKIYVGPGLYNAGAFPLADDVEIYLAGGAYVYGQFSGEDFKNIKIYGRGIVSGEIFNRRSESEYTLPVVLRNCENITINDITILDPAGWAVTLYKCENVNINNIKIITARQNGDGISVQSSKHVTVKGGFVRTWDDSLVVKNSDRGTTDDVLFDGVVVWTDLAQSMEVGYETYGATMNDITFQNITVIHNFHKALISMHNCDDAVITNVTYKNITLEDGQMLGDDRDDGENDFLIDFTIAYNIDWTKSEGNRGSIDGVTIENVNVYKMAETIGARFNGESPDSMIKNVSIKGLKIGDKMIESLTELDAAVNNFVENVTITKTNKVLGSYITLPYHLALSGDTFDIVENTTPSQEGMLVPSFAYQQGGLPYIGVKGNYQTEIAATHGAGTKTSTPVDDGTSGEYSAEGSNTASLMDNDETTYWQSKDYQDVDSEFVGLTIEIPAHATVGKIRLKGKTDNSYFYTYSFEVWVRKKKTSGEMNDKYTRLSASKDYELTPAKGNVIDVNITAQEYAGIQLRFFRNDYPSGTSNIILSEIEFYPPALTYNKAIVDSTEHNDVYNVQKAVDGDPTGTSYYESKGFPAHIVIDLGDVYQITTIVLCLPPSLNWAARTQNIEFFVSADTNAYDADTTKFTSIVPATDYLFDPLSGNRVTVELENPVACRYFKIVINSNDIKGGYGAQLSEISVYGV